MPTDKFKKGNKKGQKFSKDYQPENKGRKPSRFKELIGKLEVAGEPLCKDDLNKIITYLLTLNPEELQKLANDKKTPLAVLIIASSISGDIESRNINNFEKLIDRIYGKSTQVNEVSVKDTIQIGYKKDED